MGACHGLQQAVVEMVGWACPEGRLHSWSAGWLCPPAIGPPWGPSWSGDLSEQWVV